MAEDEDMEDMCSVVTLMHMVNPSTFWVKEPYQDVMSKEQNDLWNMEEILTRQFKRNGDYGVGTFIDPKDGEMVAVRNPDSCRWHRGILKCMVNLSKGYAYHVFLVDHGIQLQVTRSDIRKLPNSMRSLTHQAYQLCLYGVVPITLEANFEENKMKPKISKDWTSAAFSFVNDIVNNYRTAHFIRKSTVGKKVYGDLFIIIEDEQQNLASILCDNNFATYQIMTDEIQMESTTCNGEVKLDSGSPCLYNTPTRKISKLEDYLQELKCKGKQKGDENKIEEWKSRNGASQISSEDSVETHEEKSVFKIFPLGRGQSLLKSIKDVTPGKNQEETTLQLNMSQERKIKESCLKLLHLLSPPKSVLSDNDLNVSKLTTPIVFSNSPFAIIKMESDDTEQETYRNAIFIPAGADISKRHSKPNLLKNSSSADNKIPKKSPSFSKRQLPSKQYDKGIRDQKVYDEVPTILDLLNKYTLQHLEESKSKEVHNASCVKEEETFKEPVESPTKLVCETPKPSFFSRMVKMLGPLEDKKVNITEVKEASSGYTHHQSGPSPKTWKSEDAIKDMSLLDLCRHLTVTYNTKQ